MWTKWTAVLAGALLVAAAADLETDYTRDRALRIESTSTYSMETTDFSMEVNGEPMDRTWGGGGGSETLKRVVTIDRVLAHDEGRPTRVRRAFELVAMETVLAFGEEDREIETEGPLAEVTLEIDVNEDGDIEIEVVEGDEPDQEAALEGHRPALALDALLPEDDVSEGDSWDLERDAILRAIGLDLEGALFPRPEPEEGEEEGRGGGRRGRWGGRGAGGNRLLLEAEWEGTAVVISDDEEVEGQSCVVIELEIEASGELEEQERTGRRGGFSLGAPLPSVLVGTTYEIELEGRLAWSLEEGRPVLLELEGSVTTERLVEREGRGGAMRISTTQEGTLEVLIAVTEEIAEDE